MASDGHHTETAMLTSEAMIDALTAQMHAMAPHATELHIEVYRQALCGLSELAKTEAIYHYAQDMEQAGAVMRG